MEKSFPLSLVMTPDDAQKVRAPFPNSTLRGTLDAATLSVDAALVRLASLQGITSTRFDSRLSQIVGELKRITHELNKASEKADYLETWSERVRSAGKKN